MSVRNLLTGRTMTVRAAITSAACLVALLSVTTTTGQEAEFEVVIEPLEVDLEVAATSESDAGADAKPELELVGIGAAMKRGDGYAEVHEIIPGGAADLDGRLKKGDLIVGVGEGSDGEIQATIDMKISDVAKHIRGKCDTVVRVEVKPVDNPEQTVVYAITRARIELKKGETRSDVPESSSAVKADAKSDAQSAEQKALATPTHHQTTIIKANVENLTATKVKCFALTPEGQVLAGCNGESGEIRVFDTDGNYVETWSTSVQPEAMYVRADGTVFVAGAGQLIKLDARGNLVKQSPAPHAASLERSTDDIRKEVLQQHQQSFGRLAQQGAMYDRVIEQTEKQIEQLREQVSSTEDEDEEDEDEEGEDEDADNEDEQDEEEEDDDVNDAKKAMAQKRIGTLEKRVAQYKQTKAQWEKMNEDRQPAELTDEQIDQRVQASIQYKLAASSISATEDDVYVATRAAVGYGFDVWRTDGEFENGKTIITKLSGCCGQMDVKVNDQGVFVAENSKHRVCRYDREGELVTTWGHGDRNSLEGFGSCCNPMNVAFGPEEVVYTAEDNTGRIKRYSPDGKLLGLVGSVELVPGCKNCSIAVGPGGDQVYMLDITRDHIVRMDRYVPGEAPEPVAAVVTPGAAPIVQPGQPPNGGRIMVRGLGTLLRLRSPAKPAAVSPPERPEPEVQPKADADE
ncbi:MAG: PDZ domain-containing protein [Pirellulales bacterium]